MKFLSPFFLSIIRSLPLPIFTIAANLMVFELSILTCMNGYAYDIFGITSQNSNLSCPWDVESASTHTSRELSALSEVPSVFLGHVWYLDFLGVSCFPIGLSSKTMQDLGSV